MNQHTKFKNYFILYFLTYLIFGCEKENNTINSDKLTEGLVAYYKFNENANDLSPIASNNGIVKGATLTTDRFGKLSSAYQFDGIDDNIQVLHNQTLNCNKFSLSIWFYYEANQPSQIMSFLLSKGLKYENYGLVISPELKGYIYIRTTTDKDIEGVGKENSFETKTWNHVVGVFDGSKFKLYMNGDLIATNQIQGKLSLNSDDLLIGGVSFPSEPQLKTYFKGKLDDIRIYNRALDDFEVSELHKTEMSN